MAKALWPLEKGAISKVILKSPLTGFLSNLFLVPKKDGGKRPVINLKGLNQFVRIENFKMEGLHTLRDLVKRRDWMTKVDLKYAYFPIPIHPKLWKFLRLIVDNNMYEFTSLPFGLSMGFYQGHKTRGSSAEGDGCTTNHVHRQYSYSGRVPSRGSENNEFTNQSICKDLVQT